MLSKAEATALSSVFFLLFCVSGSPCLCELWRRMRLHVCFHNSKLIMPRKDKHPWLPEHSGGCGGEGERKNTRALNEGFITERRGFAALVLFAWALTCKKTHTRQPNVLGEETRLRNCRKGVNRFLWGGPSELRAAASPLNHTNWPPSAPSALRLRAAAAASSSTFNFYAYFCSRLRT